MLRLRRANTSAISSLLKSNAVGANKIIASSTVRFNSTKAAEPEQVFTKLTDENDPQRDAFFKYTWGSWLKNDKQEKEKRLTRFSIEGTTKVLQGLYNSSKEYNLSKNLDKNGAIVVKPPTKNADNTVTLTHNLTSGLLGQVNPNEKFLITSMASIHEGKHHRVYKVKSNSGKSFVLRIPYPLDTEYATSLKIKSEVATLDFLNLKLGANVPKVFSYGTDYSNPLKTPYIIMEYLEGDLLMKQWNPLVPESDLEHKEKILKVINPLADFNEKLLSITFNKFGSLYFSDDVDATLQKDLAYEGETNPLFINRWKIGPSAERIYFKDKPTLGKKDYSSKLGPWGKDSPVELITSVANIELENIRSRIALADADASSKVENKELLNGMIATYEHLKTIAPCLFKTDSPSIPNVQELFKPRLYHPDIDPMNVIMHKAENSDDYIPYFVDFEHVSIKPLIFQNAPSFVAYDGPKIYSLKDEVENFENLDDVEKEQYIFMNNRTRNQYLWEAGLNERRKDLISSVAPPVKLLRAPYVQAIEKKTDKDYLYIENPIIQLQEVWSLYFSNNLVQTENFPIEYTTEFLDKHATQSQLYEEEVVSTPFVATKGWIPQDMFTRLKDQGIIVEDGDGYKIDTEKAL